ncbi:pentapeptide repeat-containing protein [Streptomyces sp. NPDC059037]|uniref:pentapeptide repeat-containing protein n=1 Tax=Streptomyces sp. NPDC059037 TaxID=3346710 RepID=UPI0036C2F8F0
MPAEPEAAVALRAWCDATDDETTLDASQLDLSGVDLSGADLALATLFDTKLVEAKLVGADLYRVQSADAVLDNADLSEASLAKADLRDTSLCGAQLRRANLGSADLWKVDARSACFQEATLDGASLLDVQLQGADLSNASVGETSLRTVFDEHTVVAGLSGTIFGPAFIEARGVQREIAGPELEQWLNSRGAAVRVLNRSSADITYYAKISDGCPRSSPQGIVRRRMVSGVAYDEAFTRNLRWEPTEYLRLYELGHDDVDHVKITEAEAARFVSEVTGELQSESAQ